MHQRAGRSGTGTRDDKLGSGARRRRALEELRRRSGNLSEEELAARIASGEAGDEDVPEDAVRDIHVALRHFDLPKAAAAGLVSWDPEEGAVSPTEDSDLSETEFRQLFDDGWDGAAVAAVERRGAILDELRSAGECTVEELADAVAVREADDEPSDEDVAAVAVTLHHRHLPKLAEAGLLEYDPESGMVTYEGESGSEWSERPPAPPEPRDPDETVQH